MVCIIMFSRLHWLVVVNLMCTKFLSYTTKWIVGVMSNFVRWICKLHHDLVRGTTNLRIGRVDAYNYNRF